MAQACCPLCSGDREPRDGEGWPGHDRSCAAGLAAGTTAPGPRPERGDMRPDGAWYGQPGEVADTASRQRRRAAWEAVFASAHR